MARPIPHIGVTVRDRRALHEFRRLDTGLRQLRADAARKHTANTPAPGEGDEPEMITPRIQNALIAVMTIAAALLFAGRWAGWL